MAFAVNDRVVHRLHGVGTVVCMANRQFGADAARLYYEVAIHKGTVWVPVGRNSGVLRRLTAKGELARCRNLLSSRPVRLSVDFRQRQQDVAERLRVGTLQARCEVVRDLTALGWNKPLCQSSALQLREAQEALDEEWAAVTELPVHEASRQVQALLLQGRRTFDQ